MKKRFVEIVVSIIAGVIVGLILSAFAPVGEKVLGYFQPYVNDVFYEGALIEGDWETTINFYDKTYNKLQIRLERTGYKVTGKVHCVEGYSKDEVFDLKGEFIPPLLIVTYKSLSKQSIERGAGTFLLNKNGSTLEGQIIFPDDKKNVVLASEANLERAKTKFKW